jgi:hypothetical protein
MSPAHGQETAVADLIVPLHSRRRSRARIGQKLQHLMAAEEQDSPSAVTVRS